MKPLLVFFIFIACSCSSIQVHDRFYGKWLEVKKDTKGFLIYKPCDGNTPFIEANEKKIIVHGQVEDPLYYEIVSFQIKKEMTLFYCKDNYGNIVNFSIKPYEKNKKFLLWSWTLKDKNVQKINTKMLTVNINSSKQLRKVENSCIYEKKKELEFLPID